MMCSKRPYCAGCPKADERKQANPCEYCELEVLAGEVPGELPDEKRNELRWVTSTSLDGQPFLDSFAR